MLRSRTSIAGFITIVAAAASAWLTGDYASVSTAVATGLGLIAAKDGGIHA